MINQLKIIIIKGLEPTHLVQKRITTNWLQKSTFFQNNVDEVSNENFVDEVLKIILAENTSLLLATPYLFSENPVVGFWLNEKFKRAGQKLIFADGLILETIFDPQFTALVQEILGLEDNLTLNRFSRGKTIKKQKGGFIGGAVPLGFKNINGVLKIDPKEAKIVSLIFQRHAQSVTNYSIAKELNSLGYASKRGHLFKSQTIDVIIKNHDFYLKNEFIIDEFKK